MSKGAHDAAEQRLSAVLVAGLVGAVVLGGFGLMVIWTVLNGVSEGSASPDRVALALPAALVVGGVVLVVYRVLSGLAAADEAGAAEAAERAQPSRAAD